MPVTRREFLATPSLAAAAAPAPWFDKPMRWSQLTLVENDPPELNIPYWLDYFRRCRSDAVTLSAGGVVAYYPTKVPFHYRSAYLENRDSFGDLARGCRDMGTVVVARVDPHAAHEDVFRAHPDWLQVDEKGEIRRHWVMPDLYLTCPHGPYNRQFLTEVIREIVTLYKVDGVFANRWANHNSFEVCYCANCRASFGRELPRARDPRDKLWRDYTVWYQESLFSLVRMWDAEVRKINPGACFIPNSGGGIANALDWKRFGEMAATLVCDHQGRSGLTPPWSNGMAAKIFRSVAGPRKALVGIFGINVATSYRWMKSVKSAAEQRVWVAEGIANGFRPWFTKFGGVQEDERWMPAVEKMYRWHAGAERWLRDREPAARVGLVYSQQTAHYYRGPAADSVNGMYHALIEARVPFEMVHEGRLEDLRRFKLLVLPNVAALSDAQCQALAAFADAGGSLLATFETSLYDEWGNPRPDFGLAKVFGIRRKGGILGPLRNSYLAFHGKPGARHPILAGFDDAAYTVNAIRAVETEPAGAIPDAPITLIPGYPDLPMEYVYERAPRGHVPQVFLREGPRGSRTVYFPMDLDRTFWEVMLEDHGRLLANAVRWAANEEPPVTVTGPGLLDITVWRKPDASVVHLVNFTNPMMLKGPIRELIPVGPLKMRVRVPRPAKSVRLLVGGAAVVFDNRAGAAEFTVPRVLDHEVAVVE